MAREILEKRGGGVGGRRSVQGLRACGHYDEQQIGTQGFIPGYSSPIFYTTVSLKSCQRL